MYYFNQSILQFHVAGPSQSIANNTDELEEKSEESEDTDEFEGNSENSEDSDTILTMCDEVGKKLYITARLGYALSISSMRFL